MIPSTHTPGTRVIQTQGKAMSVIMDEKSAHTLSSTIYSSHRIPEAMLRELATNAFDSHIKAGKRHVPITIQLPSESSPYLKVIDEGVGLSREEGEEFLTNYFASGSQHEENPIGYYGLGAKSPQAYTDTYTVEMVKDGLKNTLLIYKDETGIPRYHFARENQPTTENNGVSYTVPIQERDIRSFHKAAREVLPYFPVRPNVDTGTFSSNLENDFEVIEEAFQPSLEMEGISVIFLPEESLPQIMRTHPSRDTIMIRMGTVLYPVSTRSLVIAGALEPTSCINRVSQILSGKVSLVLDLDIAKHGMPVNPGREGILSTKENMRKIEKIVRDVQSKLKELYDDKVKGLTPWEASCEVYLSGGLLSKARKQKDYSLYTAIIMYGQKYFSKIWWQEQLVPYGCAATLIRASRNNLTVKRVDIQSKALNMGVGIRASDVQRVLVQECSSITLNEMTQKIYDEMLGHRRGSGPRQDVEHTLIITAKKAGSSPVKAMENILGKGATVFKKENIDLPQDAARSIRDFKATVVTFSLGECREARPIPLEKALKASFYKRKNIPVLRLTLTTAEYQRYKEELKVFTRLLAKTVLVLVQDFDKGILSRWCLDDINLLYSERSLGIIEHDLLISSWKAESLTKIEESLGQCGLEVNPDLSEATLTFLLYGIKRFCKTYYPVQSKASKDLINSFSYERHRIKHFDEIPYIIGGSRSWNALKKKISKETLTNEVLNTISDFVELIVKHPLEMAHVCDVAHVHCESFLRSAKIELNIHKMIQEADKRKGAA